MSRTIIAVDGIDGSGKSTFARLLCTRLVEGGVPCVQFSIDDFRCAVDWSSAPEVDVYYDAYYDLAGAQAALAAFLDSAAEVSIPVFDVRAERTTGTRSLPLAGVQVLVVEGVFSLRLAAAAAGVVVHLDTSEAEARRRIIERDLRKGRTREEIERRIDQRYVPSQRRYRAAHAPRERADIIIDNEHPTVAYTVKRDVSRLPTAVQRIVNDALPTTAAAAAHPVAQVRRAGPS